MIRVNENYLKLAAGYLFPEIGRRVSAFTEANPDALVFISAGNQGADVVPPGGDGIPDEKDAVGSSSWQDDDAFDGEHAPGRQLFGIVV